MDLVFEGFAPEAFAVLERLRENPHVEQYRKEKEAIREYITEPFKKYRDDLVVHWVLPEGLPLETEKNVFSRLLKNDFGAGGCHHHQWMAFYQLRRKRLLDVQLSHSIYPDKFTIGLFVGDYAQDLLAGVLRKIRTEPESMRDEINELIESGYKFSYYQRGNARNNACHVEREFRSWPDDLDRANGLWVRKAFSREQVLTWQSDLVPHALEEIRRLQPLYLQWAQW